MEKKTFPCPRCPKILSRSTILADHLRSHADDRPHQCQACQKSFVRLWDLKEHRAIHDGEPKYICAWQDDQGYTRGCGRRFERKQTLKRHQLRDSAASCNIIRISTTESSVQPPPNRMPPETYEKHPPVIAGSDYPGPFPWMLATHWRRRREGHDTFAYPSHDLDPMITEEAADETYSVTPDDADANLSHIPNEPLEVARQTDDEVCDVAAPRNTLVALSNVLFASSIERPLIYTNVSHEVDTLWRVGIVAGFTFIRFLEPMFTHRPLFFQQSIALAENLYWQVIQSSQKTLRSMTLSTCHDAKMDRPDLLFALNHAASVLSIIARGVGDAQGAEIHRRFHDRMCLQLDQSMQILPGNLDYVTFMFDATDRYQLRLTEHLNAKNTHLLEQGQAFLVETKDLVFKPVSNIRKTIRLSATQRAEVTLLRTHYEAIRQIVADHGEAASPSTGMVIDLV